MKGVLEGVASGVMGLYLIFRIITSILGLLLSGGLFGFEGLYWGILLLTAFAASVLTFTRTRQIAAFLAIGIAVAAFVFWMKSGSRPGFVTLELTWMVLPEAIFAVAVLAKLKLSEPVQN